jgi:hypothetical protein
MLTIHDGRCDVKAGIAKRFAEAGECPGGSALRVQPGDVLDENEVGLETL